MFENTYLVTDKLATYSEAEVDTAEAQLGTRFPEGYREYMTRLGVGEYCGCINVFPPQTIINNQLGGKPPLEEFCDLWDGTEFGISPERLAQAILVATSIYGDMAIVEADVPGAIYVLAESEEVVYKSGATLMEAVTWLREPQKRSGFRYFDSRIDQQHEPVPRTLRLSLDKFRDWLLGLGRHDHLEETWNENPGVSLEMYRLLEGRMDLIAPELGQIIAFYQSFSGYVSASVDGAGNVSAEVVHDAAQSTDLMRQIVEYLQSKSA